MYTCMCMCRERKKRYEKQRARAKVTIIQMESQSPQTRDKRRHWKKCVSLIQKKSSTSSIESLTVRWRQLTHLTSWPNQSRQWPYCAGAPSLDHVDQQECSWGLAYCEDQEVWRRLVPGEDSHAQGTLQLLWKYTQSNVCNKCTQNKTHPTHLGISARLTAVTLTEIGNVNTVAKTLVVSSMMSSRVLTPRGASIVVHAGRVQTLAKFF